MTFLLDSNVVSELRRVRTGRADPNVVAWAEAQVPSSLFLSAIVVFELELGVRQKERTDPVQGRVLRLWLDGQVLPAFEGRVLPVDTAIAVRAAPFHVPDPAPMRDSLIAAAAAHHSLTVATRNIDDFARTGVPLVNPWTVGLAEDSR